MNSWLLIALLVGVLLGAHLAYWVEDCLRGPILRAYDDALAEIEVLQDSD